MPTDIFVAARLQRGAEHLHKLGPRATAELLAEVGKRIGGMTTILDQDADAILLHGENQQAEATGMTRRGARLKKHCHRNKRSNLPSLVTCIHEAAHVVAHLVLDELSPYPAPYIGYVTVVPDEGRLGHVKTQPRVYPFETRPQLEALLPVEARWQVYQVQRSTSLKCLPDGLPKRTTLLGQWRR